jgi:hydroxyacylglutathione hydrolase
MLQVHQFPCLSDNYGVLVHDPATGTTVSIDAPKAETVLDAVRLTGWKLTHIFTTHHHFDHTDGNLAVKAATGCKIIGPKDEAEKIPGIDKLVGGGDRLKIGAFDVDVIDTPGHTIGHISFHIPSAKMAFVGDTLFAMGCGRILEGAPEMMWASIERLAKLPADTMLYCGHEYTLSNAKFALTVEPDNAALQARLKEVERLRAAGQPTLPTRLDRELETNPFIRARSPAIRKTLGLEKASDAAVFTEVRARKNRA